MTRYQLIRRVYIRWGALITVIVWGAIVWLGTVAGEITG